MLTERPGVASLSVNVSGVGSVGHAVRLIVFARSGLEHAELLPSAQSAPCRRTMGNVRVSCCVRSLFLVLTVVGLVFISQLLYLSLPTSVFKFVLQPGENQRPGVSRKRPPVNGSCPEPSTDVGSRIDVAVSDPPTFAELEKRFVVVGPGGHFTPQSCTPVNTVAIIVPYRDRESHLRLFLQNIHPFLMNQSIEYEIFIIEPTENETFNRGKLMNVGFVEAQKLYNWSCVIFHDIDLIPEDTGNAYTCDGSPRHFSVAVDKLQYKLPYSTLLGGVTGFTREQFITINGFSNSFWGWGGEDDDLYTRTAQNNFKVSRYPANIARYKMLPHKHESSNPINPCRHKLLRYSSVRWMKDGLSDLNYTVLQVDRRPLFVRIVVDLHETESRRSIQKLCER